MEYKVVYIIYTILQLYIYKPHCSQQQVQPHPAVQVSLQGGGDNWEVGTVLRRSHREPTSNKLDLT